eukprot:CAMPEP_0172296826 /NCGR_PEP_ID=MMETSP1058-20130122/22_1 /TAXON_ID=83371 /ORGANISM="Detonula confervacea, Strain CCMP 353" /LENGTH=263 /DNA_ID=CAMNT_0013005887 /DNA_START=174 /DNA_END=965 /DNA_ORIENTATION=+
MSSSQYISLVLSRSSSAQGYTFDAEFNGRSFPVNVPVGGVEEGQKFSIPFPAAADADGYSGSAIPYASGPVGHWKDSLCDCCQLGCCHPVFWNAYCCPLILLGQVMTRLKLTWLAKDGSIAQTTRTFRTMVAITVGWISLRLILNIVQAQNAPLDENGQPTDAYLYYVGTSWALSVIFIIFIVGVVAKTRQRIRQTYGIPEQSCGGCEDCCCAYWCTCCTISQMARHTADYETYAGQCCSDTGLPPHAPALDAWMSPHAHSIV